MENLTTGIEVSGLTAPANGYAIAVILGDLVAKKISAKRAGLLQLMTDRLVEGAKHGFPNIPTCFPQLDWVELEKYGLSTFDSIQITLARKAGQIEPTQHPGIYNITEAGKKALEDFKA